MNTILKTKYGEYNLTSSTEDYVRYDTSDMLKRISFFKKRWHIEVQVKAGIKIGSASHQFETEKKIEEFSRELFGDCFDEVAFIERYSEYNDEDDGVGLISGGYFD